MNPISRKKESFPVSGRLKEYLAEYERDCELPVGYRELLQYSSSFPLLDKLQNDTPWETTVYEKPLNDALNRGLTKIYSILKTSGDMSVIEHLYVDRVDYCTFGNSNPFRIRIVNHFNDNHDYFYVKKADASRIYGLELEHILSPNRIGYRVQNDTLIEEHIAGIPGDAFFAKHLVRPELNKVRIAKEFVKFNQRCFIRLLGDMRCYNYVIDVTPDFEDEQYRIRVIDFDQQSYEGRRIIYLPEFFEDNGPIVRLCTNLLNYEAIKQYQFEERALVARRFKSSYQKVRHLLSCMEEETLSKPEKVVQLKHELARYHENNNYLKCGTMGQIVALNINVALSGMLDE